MCIRDSSDSAVDIDYRGVVRRIALRTGEIYLVSGHDPLSRPLFVETRDGRAQALGTRYRVRQWDDHSAVSYTHLDVYKRQVSFKTKDGYRDKLSWEITPYEDGEEFKNCLLYTSRCV